MDDTLKDSSGGVSGSASNALPGRRLAPSKNPRMLTPPEIDLLRQDLQEALKLLGQDEIDDTHALMRARGFRPADFEIIHRPDPSSAFPSAITGTVTLVLKSNRTARTYEAGYGSSWLEQFDNDLKRGTFGRSAG
ncbi:MAG TPA: hypothetical protein VJQ47_17285 [Steroidobacteraceae bacterium]|nr:hypothetical protein [Steroidobacteraceae bacterium]